MGRRLRDIAEVRSRLEAKETAPKAVLVKIARVLKVEVTDLVEEELD